MWTSVVRLLSRLRFARTRGRLDDEARREIESHLDLLVERYRRAGMAAEEARTAARRQFGNVTLVREELHEMNGVGPAALLVDLRDAVRGLRAGKGTTALAFGILTLTLAAGTVTFSVVDAVALRPLPYQDTDRLVAVAHLPRADGNLEGAAPQDYFSWRDATQSFEGLAGAFPGAILRLETEGASEELVSARATANLFDVLGVRPILGRSFRPEEEAPGGQSGVVVLTHSLWSRRFGADPSVIGRRIALRRRQDASSYQIVGVLPPGVTYPITALRPVELFLPYVATAAERDHASRGRSYGLHVVGRLGPGVTLEQARSDVDRVNAAVRAAYYSQSAIAARYVVLSLHDRVVGPAKSWLLLVLAAVTCVLLVGCVNAASLLLARATVRTRELATRAAVGASRARLARTLLAEGLVLALIASAAATLLAFWGLAFTKAHLPEDLTRTGAIALDTRVLIASIGAAVLCGLFAGGVPAWRVMRSALVEQMRVGGAIIGGRRQERSLAAFLMAEVAFVTVLLVATTLAVASFVLVTTADLGFDRRNVMAIEVSKSLQGVPDDDRRAAAAAFFADVLDRARAVPGVTAAGLVGGFAPLSGSSIRYSIVIPGIGELEGEDMFETREVSPEYFPALGLRILRGRSFAASDGAGAPAVAIINDLAARRYFPGREPLGELVIFRDRPTRIVGVVQNVRLHGPEADWHTEIYIPLAQSPQIPRVAFAELVVRTAGNAAGTGPAVREAIRPALAGQVAEPRFVDEAFHRLTSARRFNAGLMTLFGLLAVVIGGIGIYGTMAFVVAQQTRAIGLRMALGVSQTNVLRSVLGESLWRVGLGTTLGMICAWSVSSLFSALVFGIQTTSPTVYAGVALGLGILGLLAALVPARRAARLDPLAALRAE